MIEARVEWARSQGYNIAVLAEQGYLFVVSSLSVKYFLPAKLDDCLLVCTKVLQRKKCSALLQQNVARVDKPDEILCQAEIRVACIDKIFKPKPIPNTLFADEAR